MAEGLFHGRRTGGPGNGRSDRAEACLGPVAGVARRAARRSRRPATLSGPPMLFAALLSGLTLGGMYALMAMGLTLQYGVARIMNLAHGELMVAAAFTALW